MFAIEMLPAGHGDALVVEYGSRENPHRLLVDAGPMAAWPAVRKRLLGRRDSRYEVFVVTHVDEDHLGAALALLDDFELRNRITNIWFNGYVHCAAGGSVLGPVMGEQLTSRIVTGHYKWNAPFPRSRAKGIGGPVVVPANGDLPVVPLAGGARVVMLSPSAPKLKRMEAVWREEVTKAGLVPGAGDEGHNVAPKPSTKKVPQLPATFSRELLQALAAGKHNDGSEANGSSIAFIVEHEGRRLLLAADAHADVLADGLARYGTMVGEPRPRVHLFKLAHHGSRANTSNQLIESVDCRRYLVSSSGDSYGHPDDTALARAILGSTAPLTIYCNYASVRTTPWVRRGQPFDATFKLPAAGRAGLRVNV